jgi:hypothetical protein
MNRASKTPAAVAEPSRLLRHGAALFIALLYFFALPGVMPGIFSALARIEGSHGVEVSTVNGETSVVLTHHAAGQRVHDCIHHHSLLARALTALSTPRDSDPDHVVHFSSGGTFVAEKSSELRTAAAAVAHTQLAAYSAAAFFAQPATSVSIREKTRPPRPPAQLALLRSTLLLI